jgi:predicted DNA-binding WGR domain protein
MNASGRATSWPGAVLLHRIRPERDEKRFYFIAIGPALFDPLAVIRVWGRIGGHQRALLTPCASTADAQTLAVRLVRRRLRHGYHLVQGEAAFDQMQLGPQELKKQRMPQ